MKAKTLSAAQAADRLGVRIETIYAYVSREILSRSVGPDGRSSRFEAAEVEALARRGRPRKGSKRVGTVDVSLASSITQVSPEGRLAYRGHEIGTLAASHHFEQVAELLWTGAIPARPRWSEGPDQGALRVAQALPKGSPPVERLAVIASAMACARPHRSDLRDATVIRHARELIQTFVAALPLVGKDDSARGGRLASRLWPRLSALSATRSRVRALDTALVVLADHELATSTLAARVAASTRADPFLAILGGLAAVSGALHGRAAAEAYHLLEAADSTASAESAVANALSPEAARRGVARLPGFGHPVYEESDPRTEILLARVLETAPRDRRGLIEGVRAAANEQSDSAANIDFALGALAFANEMSPSATEAIFAIARTAGWIAHILEEYGEAPLRFRARAIYDGS
jgi:citrate synthase